MAEVNNSVKIYVLYYDCLSDEGCGPPEGVTFNSTEADAWRKKDEHDHYCVEEFDVTLPK